MKKDVLFLHLGPGGNAFVERQWLSHLQRVEFWDQPHLTGNSGLYNELVQACEKRASELAQINNGSISIWGHSFGANIALEILNRRHVKVKELVLISPLVDLPRAFFNLAVRLKDDARTDRNLKNELEGVILKFKNTPQERTQIMWQIVGLVAKDPQFGRLYWHSTDAMNRYNSLVSQGPQLDTCMWAAVLADYLSARRNLSPQQPPKSHVYIGEYDPYVANPKDEADFWQKALPAGQISVVQAGYNCHLEMNILKA